MVSSLDLAFVILYFIFVISIGLYARRKENKEGFLIANRKLGVFALTATIIASFFGGNSLVTFTALVFQFGAAAFWGYFGVTVGFILIYFLSKRIKQMADKGKFYTFSDYFKKKYGVATGKIVGAVVFVLYLGYLIVQFIAGGTILSVITGWSYPLAILIMGTIVIFYVFMGGFRAVVKTDLFQYVIILTLLVVVAFSFIRGGDFFAKTSFNPFKEALSTIPFFVYGIITTMLGAELWQRIYAGSSVKTVKKSLLISSVVIFFLGLLMTLIGLAVKASFPNVSPQSAIAVGFTQLLPPGIFGLGLVILFAAIMSTIDTYLFMLAVSFSNNFLKRGLVKHTKFMALLIGVIAMGIAVIFSNIINVMVVIGSILFSLFPATIASFFFKLKPLAVSLSIIIAVIASVIGIFIVGFEPMLAIVPLGVGTLGLIICQVVALPPT